MAVEEAFQIAIPDDAAEQMLTPAQLVEYVAARLGEADRHGCLEQRAFHRLRRATIRLFAVQRAQVRPATRWAALLPSRQLRHNWHLLRQAVGVPQWPGLTFWGKIPENVATVGGTAEYLAVHAVAALQGEERWTRRQIEDTIVRLMRDQLGITKFEWNQEFVKDLGVD